MVNIDDFKDLKNLGAKNLKVRRILIKDLIQLIKDAKKNGIELKSNLLTEQKNTKNFYSITT